MEGDFALCRCEKRKADGLRAHFWRDCCPLLGWQWSCCSSWGLLGKNPPESEMIWILHKVLVDKIEENCMRVKLLQSRLTFCHPMDCSPPGSSVRGFLQARILEWVAMPSLRGSSWLQGIQPACLMSSVLAGGLFTTSATWEAQEESWAKLNSHSQEMLKLGREWTSFPTLPPSTGSFHWITEWGVFWVSGLCPWEPPTQKWNPLSPPVKVFICMERQCPTYEPHFKMHFEIWANNVNDIQWGCQMLVIYSHFHINVGPPVMNWKLNKHISFN